jgi:hypothetical protein
MIRLAMLLISAVVNTCHRPRRASAVRDDCVCRALIVGAFQSVGYPLLVALAALDYVSHFHFLSLWLQFQLQVRLIPSAPGTVTIR